MTVRELVAVALVVAGAAMVAWGVVHLGEPLSPMSFRGLRYLGNRPIETMAEGGGLILCGIAVRRRWVG